MKNTTPKPDTLELVRRATEALTSAGLVLNDELDCSGVWARCGTAKKPNGTDGAYKVHLDWPPNLWLCNYHDGHGGEKVKVELWNKAENDRLTEAEREEWRERMRREKEEARKKTEERHRKAAEKAKAIIRHLTPAGEHNAYLSRKGVDPLGGLFQDKDGALVVPVLDESGKVQSLQYITADGVKTFLKGGRTGGGYFSIPAKDGSKDGPLLIGEGVATVSSACMATGYAGLVTFFCGNLLAVAEMARRKYPEREIVLLADNDCETKKTDGTPWNPGLEAATKAARAVGGRLAIPPEHEGRATDFNDLHEKRGLDAVRLVIEEARAKDALSPLEDEWTEPVPFTAHNLPKLDTASLPPALGEYCAALAEEKQVPPELVLSISLPVIATAAQNSYVVRVRGGYLEPVNLYTLCPLDPANRKSAVVEACTAPLREWEKNMALSMAPRVKEAESRRQTLDKMIEQRRNKAAKSTVAAQIDEVQREIRELEDQKPTVPRIPRLQADNITPEALAVLMRDNGGSIGIHSAEGGMFDILAGMYTNGVPNLDLILKAHSGDSFRVDRRNAPPVILDNPRLSMGISPQPVTLETRTASKAFRGRGLDARFLYFMPDSLIGRRSLEPAPMNPAIRERFHQKVRDLLPLQWEEERPEPVELQLTEEAYRHWLAFYGAVEKELAPGGELEGMSDWGGKLAGAVIRLAGLLHLVTHDRPGEVKITQETMDQATRLGGLLTEHAKAAYALMGTDDTINGAKKVLDWIQRQAADRFSVRDCFRGVQQALFSHVEDVTAALRELEERGFIRELPAPVRHGAGRKPSPVYQVNPAALRR